MKTITRWTGDHTIHPRLLPIILGLFLAFSGFAGAEPKNLALGKGVTLFPSPNYEYCTDPDDALQITDGQLTPDNRRFWTEKTTVGWIHGEPKIVIDLGGVEPIQGVSVSTVGGGFAGVLFPKVITVYVSDDNRIFHEVAKITPPDVKQDGSEILLRTLTAEGLKTRGRYVLVSVQIGGNMFFTDEIEVHGGDFDPKEVQFSEAGVSRDDMLYGAIGLAPESYTRGHFPESPHVPWAIPLGGEPVHAILMCDFPYMRDVVEIAQRLGVEYTPVSFHQPLSEAAREALLKNLPQCQVLVTGVINWAAMPADVLESIRKRVREGMGLVMVGDWWTQQQLAPMKDLLAENPLSGDQGILDFIPVSLIPGYHQPPGGAHFQLTTPGKGRVALMKPVQFTRSARYLLPTFELSDYIEGVNGPLEYWFAALNKLILWAAGRDGHFFKTLEISPEGKLLVETQHAKAAAKVRVTVRDPYFQEVATWEKPVSPKGVAFQLPEGPRGTWVADVWLLDAKGGVLDFGSASLERKGSSGIASLKEVKPSFTAGDPVQVLVDLQQPKSPMQLRASLVDTAGREVSSPQTIPVGEREQIALSFPYPDPLTLGATVQVDLVNGEKVLDRKRLRVWVEKPETKDFLFLGWGTLDDCQPVADFAHRTMREEIGLDGTVSLYQLNRVRNGGFADVRFSPENFGRIAPPQGPYTDGIRKVCLNNPTQQGAREDQWKLRARESRRYGTAEWSLGDEEALAGLYQEYCFSADCLRAFREWIQGQYANLAELNKTWETQYKDWSEVTPVQLKDIKDSKNFAPWLDYRRFMETTFANHHQRALDVVTAENPHARVGLSGTQQPSSFNGYDYWKLMNAVNHISGYGGVQAELQRSFRRPGTFSTTFLGYDTADTDEQGSRGDPWRILFSGGNGLNYFMLSHYLQPWGIFRPDLSPTRKVGWLAPEIRELKAGVGKLFVEGAYADDGIAIHYSPASLHAATAVGLFDAADPRRHFNGNLASLIKLLKQSHYQFRFVHEDQMAQGELSKFKVLFLPWSSAISPAEAEAIRGFVKNGGTLIADSWAGVRNAHGQPAAMLEDVLRVRQPLDPPALNEDQLQVQDGDFSGPREITVPSGVKSLELLADAKARGQIGQAPAMIAHPYGKGRAIFLNASFSNYTKETSGGEGGEILVGKDAASSITAPMRAFLTALLNEAGVPVPIQAKYEGVEDPEIEVSRFALGDSLLVGVQRTVVHGLLINKEDQQAFTLDWGEPRHVYDIRERKYLGKVANLKESLPKAIARAYAFLPYTVDGMEIIGVEETTPGETVRLNAKISTSAPPGKHVLHADVTGPDGKDRRLYAQNVVAVDGSAWIEIPFAWNDPAGKWVVTVRDVATGVTKTHPIQLRK